MLLLRHNLLLTLLTRATAAVHLDVDPQARIGVLALLGVACWAPWGVIAATAMSETLSRVLMCHDSLSRVLLVTSSCFVRSLQGALFCLAGGGEVIPLAFVYLSLTAIRVVGIVASL